MSILSNKVTVVYSSKDTFTRTLKDEGADMLAIVRNCMRTKPLYFSYNRANKSIHNAEKLISFWFLDRVITFLLDSNVSEGSNIATADGADNSLRKLNFIEERNDFKTVVHSLFTDARGGETHEGLATKMPK